MRKLSSFVNKIILLLNSIEDKKLLIIILLVIGFLISLLGEKAFASMLGVLASIATIYALAIANKSLKVTNDQIEKSNIKSIAATYLSKLNESYNAISYKSNKPSSVPVTGRAAVVEALLSIDGSQGHYFTVDALSGYLKLYLEYLKHTKENAAYLGKDYSVHKTVIDHDFVHIKNEVSRLIGNLNLIGQTSMQYEYVSEAKNNYEKLSEYYRQSFLK